MITDNQIKRISFIIAVIGILGIAIASQFIDAEKLGIKDIDDSKLGRIVEVNGTISSYSTKDGHVFIDLTDGQNKVQVVMFERTARNQKSVYDLKKEYNVTVTGKVLLYHSDLEIQADIIKLIN